MRLTDRVDDAEGVGFRAQPGLGTLVRENYREEPPVRVLRERIRSGPRRRSLAPNFAYSEDRVAVGTDVRVHEVADGDDFDFVGRDPRVANLSVAVGTSRHDVR